MADKVATYVVVVEAKLQFDQGYEQIGVYGTFRRGEKAQAFADQLDQHLARWADKGPERLAHAYPVLVRDPLVSEVKLGLRSLE